MKKIKIGVFGAFRGEMMMKFSAVFDKTELVAVCDKSDAAIDYCKKTALEHNVSVKFYKDFDSFIQHDMDAVVLANYANEHAPFAIRCLKQGLHVLSEVLPCQSLAEAVQLVEAVESSGKVYAYAENYCYFKSVLEMKRRYDSGDFGDLLYAEGEYIHDCGAFWPSLTYGEKDHWRNTMSANFYCTHSIGPIIHMTKLRPVQVVGYETMPSPHMLEMGDRKGAAGMEIITLENGAILRSTHGNLRKDSVWYNVQGTVAGAECDRYRSLDVVRVHTSGGIQTVEPEPFSNDKAAKLIEGHGGSDFYTMYYFIQKILGEREGAESTDIYEALDMFLPGLLAHRSVLNGNIPVKIPNLRLKADRDLCRFDISSTDSKSAGIMLLPISSKNIPDIPDEVYARVKKQWLDGLKK